MLQSLTAIEKLYVDVTVTALATVSVTVSLSASFSLSLSLSLSIRLSLSLSMSEPFSLSLLCAQTGVPKEAVAWRPLADHASHHRPDMKSGPQPHGPAAGVGGIDSSR